jgi:hypothetical protein
MRMKCESFLEHRTPIVLFGKGEVQPPPHACSWCGNSTLGTVCSMADCKTYVHHSSAKQTAGTVGVCAEHVCYRDPTLFWCREHLEAHSKICSACKVEYTDKKHQSASGDDSTKSQAEPKIDAKDALASGDAGVKGKAGEDRTKGADDGADSKGKARKETPRGRLTRHRPGKRTAEGREDDNAGS